MNCHRELLEHLHTKWRIRLDDIGHNKRTALHLAARYGKCDTSNFEKVTPKHAPCMTHFVTFMIFWFRRIKLGRQSDIFLMQAYIQGKTPSNV